MAFKLPRAAAIAKDLITARTPQAASATPARCHVRAARIAAATDATALSLADAAAQAQRLVVAPAAEVLVGELLTIHLEGLPPATYLTLIASRSVSDWDGLHARRPKW